MTESQSFVLHPSRSPARDAHADDKAVLGFWAYLMTDCVLFAALFATYVVLRPNIADGPSGKDIFDLRLVLVETFLLLTSSAAYGLAMLELYKDRLKRVLFWMFVTFSLGAAFVGMEISEFSRLIAENNGPDRSGFLSSFFTLVGAHGLHVTVGLIWMAVMMVQVALVRLPWTLRRRMTCLGMFWHFLDIIWIGLFTVVYLMEVAG